MRRENALGGGRCFEVQGSRLEGGEDFGGGRLGRVEVCMRLEAVLDWTPSFSRSQSESRC